jgi:DNA-directed RNA polymerase specialized sigma24 family protein
MGVVVNNHLTFSEIVAEDAVTRSFVTAYLLTADARRTEDAVSEAIDLFDPQADSEEGLIRIAIAAALQEVPLQLGPTQPQLRLPAELRAVLRLANDVRQCFVLRVLVGLSEQSSGCLLGLDVRRVREYVCAAVRQLAGVET